MSTLSIAVALIVGVLASAPAGAEQSAEIGLATVYGADMAGRPTASGEPYDDSARTAAHKSYPLGTRLKVTHLGTGRSVVVRVNDRGPASPTRIVNLSGRAAHELGFDAGLARVQLDVIELGDGKPASSTPPAAAKAPAMGAKAPSAAVKAPPPAVAAIPSANPSRRSQCLAEAKLLGLSGDFLRRHLRTCMASKRGE